MDEKKRRMVSFEIDVDELETIEARAAEAKLSRSEYLRARAISDPTQMDNGRLEALVKHSIYLANQVYVGLFSIADAQGKARRFLSTEELRAVYNRVRADALAYAVEFPEHFELVQAEVAGAAKNGAK